MNADAVRLGIEDGAAVVVLEKGIGRPFTVCAAHNVGGRDELLTAVLLPKTPPPPEDDNGGKVPPVSPKRRRKRTTPAKHASP